MHSDNGRSDFKHFLRLTSFVLNFLINILHSVLDLGPPMVRCVDLAMGIIFIFLALFFEA